MANVPDYREIEIPIKLQSLKNYIEPLLCTTNVVRDNEVLIGVEFGPEIEVWDTIWVKVKVKKQQELVTISN